MRFVDKIAAFISTQCFTYVLLVIMLYSLNSSSLERPGGLMKCRKKGGIPYKYLYFGKGDQLGLCKHLA